MMDAWTFRESDHTTRLVTDVEGDVVRLGIDGHDPLLPLSFVRLAMQCVDASIVNHDAMLRWTFSAVGIPIGDLRRLISDWDDTGQPPVLSIVVLNLGEHRHEIIGIEAFVGHGLAAEFSDPELARDAARNLAILARHAMVNGQLCRDTTYEGVEGRVLSLRWGSDAEPPNIVTIVL